MPRRKDYTKYSRPTMEEFIESTVEKDARVIKTGIVTDCTRLNVREDPELTARIVGTIDCSVDVIVDENQSTNTFYKVCTAAGIEGYCMKKFITITP